MLVNCQGCLCTPFIEYSTSWLSNKLPSTISRDNTKNGCEADYNKPPQKKTLKTPGWCIHCPLRYTGKLMYWSVQAHEVLNRCTCTPAFLSLLVHIYPRFIYFAHGNKYFYVIFSFLVFANSWASMCKTLFKATWTECWIVFHRNDRQAEEFTTLLKEKDDQIAQLLEEGNDWY